MDDLLKQFPEKFDKLWRKSRLYRLWKIYVIRRDKVCQCCGSRKNRHAHHIKSAKYFPELRFTISNGITLCNECHSYIHNYICGGYAKMCNDIHLEILLALSWHRRILRRKREKVMKVLN